jgi:ABC-2 type transport system ATP-binding protein
MELSKKNDDVAIEINKLKKYYDGVKAVDGLNFSIKEGELFGLLGPNGAGKTTTINILCGLIEPTEGTAIVGGYDVRKNLNKIKELIGVCPQEPAVFKFLKGTENIELFGNLHTIPKKKLKERTDKLLEIMGLLEVSKRKVKGYSGGMIRRLNLIIALINDPKILFLDEPTVGMDATSRRATWDYIGSLKNQNKTIILTTHYIEEAEVLSDRVGIIDFGKLIELGTPKDILEKYNTDNLEEVFIKITGRKIREEI